MTMRTTPPLAFRLVTYRAAGVVAQRAHLPCVRNRSALAVAAAARNSYRATRLVDWGTSWTRGEWTVEDWWGNVEGLG